MMEKKGEILTGNLIKIILIVLGAAILLFLIFLIAEGFPTSIDKESCKQSIIYRSTASLGALELKEAIPLKCKTEKICLSMSGEDCIELVGTEEFPVRKIKVDGDCEKFASPSTGAPGSAGYFYRCPDARQQVMDVFADSLISCHNMLGEGKLNFFPHDDLFDPLDYADYFGGDTGPGGSKYGLICTRIAFDNQAKEQIGPIQFGEFYKNLERKVVDGKNGLNYLYPGVRNAAEFVEIHNAIRNSPVARGEEYGDVGDYIHWAIDPKQSNGHAIISSMVEVNQNEAVIWAAGVAVAGGALLATGIGSPLGVMLLAGTGSSAVFVYNFDESYKYYAPAIFPYDIDRLKKLGVFSFEIAP